MSLLPKESLSLMSLVFPTEECVKCRVNRQREEVENMSFLVFLETGTPGWTVQGGSVTAFVGSQSTLRA